MRRLAPCLVAALPLSGCKLLLGPPMKRGLWDLELTGLDTTAACDEDATTFIGDPLYAERSLTWSGMQEIEMEQLHDGDLIVEPQDRWEIFDFTLDFDGVDTFYRDELQARVSMQDHSCEFYTADFHMEIGDRESFFGYTTLADPESGCAMGSGCSLRFWFKGAWVQSKIYD